MSAPSVDVLRWGRERARTGTWRGDHNVAYLSPVPSGPVPSVEFVKRCLDVLASRGFHRVVTGALSPFEQTSFLAAGFDVAERLHLLGIDLSGPPPEVPEGAVLVRGRRRHRADVLAVDRAAFSPFWQFDDVSLDDALDATPATRWRVVTADRSRRSAPITGYAICGRAGTKGFVQRLAIHPSAQRQGTGRRLLLDGLRWMSRRGVRSAVVNTQVGNDTAVALYVSVGFTEQANGLSVLATGLR